MVTIRRTTAELGRLFDSESSLLVKLQDILSAFTVGCTSIGFHIRQSTFYPEKVPIPTVLGVQ